ncbi:MAG TPA: Fic family protein [Candidatus Micrarchaeaceae archaeon]|nr:Fic family protein [Candidatus Micrarchaeaceae archaeon]
MDIDRLSNSPVGKLVPVRGTDARHGNFAYFAFVADPLPSDVTLRSATWARVAEATAAISRLQQACLELPDPRLLIRPALWRESLDTSALEGTEGVLRELLEAQLPSAQYMTSETREIRAFQSMAGHAFELVKRRPITVGFLSELQGELFQEAENPPEDVGRVRQHIVWIGQKDQPIEASRFVPAPPDDRLQAGMDQWELWVRAEHPHLSPVLRSAMAHYQLETLHPFGDGNGRLGRLVIILQALRSGALDQPALTLSPWLFRHRIQYQEQLLEMSCTGDWNPWVSLFCTAVREQCDILIENARKLVRWREESRHKVQEHRWTGVIYRVLEDLVDWPVITVGDAARKYSISVPHATNTINHLVEIEILTELTGRGYGRMFGAKYVMDTVDSLTSPGASTVPQQPSEQSQTVAAG